MEEHTYKLISNTKIFEIPSFFRRISKINENIYRILVKNSKYYIESNVNDDVFQSFINYWINKEIPDITPANFHEYYQLSQEFDLMNDLIQAKEEEFSPSFQPIQNLLCKKNNKCVSEELIAKNLDFYLNTNREEMMQIEITSLFNIFNHKDKNLIDNNLAYNFIKCLTEQENGQNAFILFSGIDGNKLNYENFKELFDILINRCQVFPKIDFYTSFKYLYFAKSDLHSPGIFNYLKDKQKNNFDRLFIASQSTRDIYCLIDKNSNDFYNTCNS